MNNNFDAALAAFVAHVNNLQVGQYDGKLPDDVISFETGPKYIRVVRNNHGDLKARSAFCFVERATGNVLKCAGWKGPAKGARGSIFTPATYGVTKYGAVYNR